MLVLLQCLDPFVSYFERGFFRKACQRTGGPAADCSELLVQYLSSFIVIVYTITVCAGYIVSVYSIEVPPYFLTFIGESVLMLYIVNKLPSGFYKDLSMGVTDLSTLRVISYPLD